MSTGQPVQPSSGRLRRRALWISLAAFVAVLVPVAVVVGIRLSHDISGDGIYLVGHDIEPGLYRATDVDDGCYWARLSGTGGTTEEIIDNDVTVEETAMVTVTVEPGDVAFESDGCGPWELVS